MKEEMADVSVVNLITRLQFEGESIPFAVRHPTDTSKPLQALTAGPKFTRVGVLLMGNAFVAEWEGSLGSEPRWLIPVSRLEHYMNWLEHNFFTNGMDFFDWWPQRELEAKLTEPYWDGIPPPLQVEDFKNLSLHTESGLIRQPPPEEGLEDSRYGTRVKLLREWVLIVHDRSIVHDLLRSLAIFPLSEDDLLSTNGGRCIGKAGEHYLAKNLGVEHYQP